MGGIINVNGINVEFLLKKDVNFEFNGEILLEGRSIARILGYSENSKPINRHINSNNKYKINNRHILSNNYRKLNNAGENFLTECGFLQMLQNSMCLTEYDKKEIADTLLPNKNYITFKSRNEIEFIDILEKVLEPYPFLVTRQKDVDGLYKIDLYIENHNIAIEYDENSHQSYDRSKELNRENYIKNKLGCYFIRVSDKNDHYWNVGFILKNIHKYYRK
jgi:very-short-patch-repair endonuclease